ncbi:hypothetical protein PILCRDRAFT_2464 [Piloderma croceum F 1598]|uniref:Uncharacterized protein n=1 Tax=Piloderma croceum (strain F 1598) TaxID=765440 RepID=A0A0C3GEW9_PILCF|nr:hypothetical protein PILCRDRAFT_2464 [Piloderma croceum F 1598]
MSSTRRNTASTSTGTTNHKCYTPDEFQRWRESHSKIAAIAFKEAGVRVIDFNTYKPNKWTEFQCTQNLRGRLWPNPAGADLYILDFINRNGVRVNVTQLNIYNVSPFGYNDRELINNQGTSPGSKGTVNVYTLNPGRVVEIVTKGDQLLKRISFIYTGRMTCTPIINQLDD